MKVRKTSATVPVEGGVVGIKKSATTFFKPGRYKSYTLNSEINAQWCCCLGEISVETAERAVTGGLWSVHSWKRQPSQKWRKCLIAA
jgi:hypothetical protein